MIPELDLSRNMERSAYFRVLKWLPDTVDSEEDNEFDRLGFGIPGDFISNFGQSDKRAKRSRNREIDSFVIEETQRLYKLVINVLGGEVLRLSTMSFSDTDKSSIVNTLKTEGFNVGEEDFWEIIQVAKAVRNGCLRCQRLKTDDMFTSRYASMNCFDYERFKKELKDLTGIVGIKNIERYCRTLLYIYNEALIGESEEYPGRHLPIYNLRDKTAARYQTLRIMDEILHTTDRPIKNDEMRSLIVKKAKEYRISVGNGSYRNGRNITQDHISDSVLKKYFVNLSEMISVEFSRGKKRKYTDSVYEPGKNGHRYKEFKNGKRLSAFTVEISMSEAERICREIKELRRTFFIDDMDAFAERFPFIDMLGNVDELVLDSEKRLRYLNGLTNTDMVTVNYIPVEFSALKKKIDAIVSNHIPVSVKIDNVREMIIPISVREERGNWVLVGKSRDTSLVRVIKPEALSEALGLTPEEADEDFRDEQVNIIGIGELYSDYPYDVTLELTREGIDDVSRKDSEILALNPQIEHRKIPENLRYSVGCKVDFSVYINDDFLREVFRLDKAGKLISVMPTEVNDIYEEYFEKRMGKARQSLEDRAASMKNLKEPKGEIFE